VLPETLRGKKMSDVVQKKDMNTASTLVWRKMVSLEQICSRAMSFGECQQCCWYCRELDDCIKDARQRCSQERICFVALTFYLQHFWGLTPHEAFLVALRVQRGIRVCYKGKHWYMDTL
jgi:hypothetical protein